MPFDPAKPAFGSPNSSAEMCVQLNGLKDLIDAIPAGPQGPPGVQGPPFASAVVDGVSTLNPGAAATVGATFDGANLHLTFGSRIAYAQSSGSSSKRPRENQG